MLINAENLHKAEGVFKLVAHRRKDCFKSYEESGDISEIMRAFSRPH